MHRATTFTTIAFLTGSAGYAVAESHMTPGVNSGVVDGELTTQFIRAENIIGADIYTLYPTYDEDLWSDTDYYEEIGADWEEVGEVEDIVLSRDGRIVGVIVEVGGFLDIGEADVVVDLSDMKSVGGDFTTGWDDLAFVTRLSEEQLESRQEVDADWW